MADFMTFQEIYQSVERNIKKGSGLDNLVKSVCNMVYLNEILEIDDLYPLFWLRKLVETKAAFAPMTITGVTIAAQGLIAAVNTLSVGDVFTIYNISGTVELNNRTFKAGTVAQGLSAAAIPLNDLDSGVISTTGMTAWTSGGTVHHRGITLDVNNHELLLSAAWHDEDEMIEIDPSTLEEEQRWWDDATSRPKRYMQYKSFTNAGVEVDLMLWFPASDAAYDLRYWETIRATRLSAVTDVPLLPFKFHDTIVAGAIVRLAESNVQVENAVVWPGIYAGQLSAIASYNRKLYQRHEMEKREPSLYL